MGKPRRRGAACLLHNAGAVVASSLYHADAKGRVGYHYTHNATVAPLVLSRPSAGGTRAVLYYIRYCKERWSHLVAHEIILQRAWNVATDVAMLRSRRARLSIVAELRRATLDKTPASETRFVIINQDGIVAFYRRRNVRIYVHIRVYISALFCEILFFTECIVKILKFLPWQYGNAS